MATTTNTDADQLQNIIQSEQAKMLSTQAELNSAINSKSREAALEQSNAARMAQYSYLMSIVVIALMICGVFMAIKFFLLSSVIFDILSGIVLVIAIYWAYLIYADIQQRSLTDFSELSDSSSKLIDKTGLIDASSQPQLSSTSTSGVLSVTPTVCTGSNCCAVGTIWNDVQSKCVGNVVSQYESFSLSTSSLFGKGNGSDHKVTDGVQLLPAHLYA